MRRLTSYPQKLLLAVEAFYASYRIRTRNKISKTVSTKAVEVICISSPGARLIPVPEIKERVVPSPPGEVYFFTLKRV